MTKKNEILNLLNSSEYVSGEKIAETLKISRNAVWKNIISLKKSGYKITAVPHRGYLLEDSSIKFTKSMLDIKTVKNIVILNSVDSTNTYAKNLSEKSEDTLIIAFNQTNGRGRLGRSFYSPKGSGVYMSMALLPEFSAEKIKLITVAAAVAVSAAIEKISGENTEIKWVNDIYIGDKKVCGILTEGLFDAESGKISFAVCGIGINLLTPDGGFPDDISEKAGAVFEQCNGKTAAALVSEIVNNFYGYYSRLEAKEYLGEYRNRSYLKDKTVVYEKGGKTYEGKVSFIDDEARLAVILKDGSTDLLQTGEVSVKPI